MLLTSFASLVSIPHRSAPRNLGNACRRICALATSDAKDEQFMQRAIVQAKIAASKQEVPIGAVLIDATGSILAEAHNEVEMFTDCTRHAEMNCLRRAMAKGKKWRLTGTVLYSTMEPCAMCLSALSLARVSRVVYGAPDIRLGACGSWVDLVKEKHPYHAFDQVTGGVLGDECAGLVRDFFRERRKDGSRAPST